jgi:hypothetical protein
MSMVKAGLAIGFAVLATPTASAQVIWSDPARTWSIDFASSKWGQADGLPADGPTLMIAPLKEPGDNEVRICIVQERLTPLQSGVNPTDARSRVGRMTEQDIEDAFGRKDFRQASLTQTTVNGVPVAQFEAISGRFRFRGRVFATVSGAREVFTTIACTSDPGMRPELASEVDAILATLRFS